MPQTHPSPLLLVMCVRVIPNGLKKQINAICPLHRLPNGYFDEETAEIFFVFFFLRNTHKHTKMICKEMNFRKRVAKMTQREQKESKL